METVELLWITCGIVIIPLLLGIAEKLRNNRNLRQLKVRVNINGIRGKSTITRMTTAILQEAGYRVVGKTTGTEARMFYWNREEEEILRRRPKGISISEQIRVIQKAVKAYLPPMICAGALPLPRLPDRNPLSASGKQGDSSAGTGARSADVLFAAVQGRCGGIYTAILALMA